MEENRSELPRVSYRDDHYTHPQEGISRQLTVITTPQLPADIPPAGDKMTFAQRDE